jgi:hypothetical protein
MLGVNGVMTHTLVLGEVLTGLKSCQESTGSGPKRPPQVDSGRPLVSLDKTDVSNRAATLQLFHISRESFYYPEH